MRRAGAEGPCGAPASSRRAPRQRTRGRRSRRGRRACTAPSASRRPGIAVSRSSVCRASRRARGRSRSGAGSGRLFTTKPGVSLHRTASSPCVRWPEGGLHRIVGGEILRTISTSGMSGAGLKKCRPRPRWGRHRGGDLGDGERRRVGGELRPPEDCSSSRTAPASARAPRRSPRRRGRTRRAPRARGQPQAGERASRASAVHLLLLHLRCEAGRDPVAPPPRPTPARPRARRPRTPASIAELGDAGAHRAEADHAAWDLGGACGSSSARR